MKPSIYGLSLGLPLLVSVATGVFAASLSTRVEEARRGANELKEQVSELKARIESVDQLTEEVVELGEALGQVEKQNRQTETQLQTERAQRIAASQVEMDLRSRVARLEKSLDLVRDSMERDSADREQQLVQAAKMEEAQAAQILREEAPIRSRILALEVREKEILEAIREVSERPLDVAPGASLVARAALARQAREAQAEAIQHLQLKLNPITEALERERRQLEALYAR